MKRKIRDNFEYFLYILFKFIFLITPKFLMKRILQFLAFLAYHFDREHKHIAKANIDLVYKNSIDSTIKERIIYNSYKSLAFNMYEFIENQDISKEEMFQKANIINSQIIKDAFNNNRKIIYITAHYGGWELTLPYIAMMFGEIAVVNRKMDNPYIQELYAKARTKNKITMLEKQVAAKGMIKAFKENKSVAVVIDQHIGKGIEIEFLGQKALATDSTARLALKFDALIIPIFTECNGFRDYTINVGEAIDVKTLEFKSDDPIKELTQLQNNLVTKQVFDKPDYWLWQHKRFKKYHNNIYLR